MTAPLGPFAIIVRRRGSFWHVVGLYQKRSYRPGGFARVARSVAYARIRREAMEDVRVMAR